MLWADYIKQIGSIERH